MNGERIVVVAPHPDDEVLGVGGTIAKRADAGAEVHVIVVTRGHVAERVARSRREAKAAHDVLGVAHTHYLDLPAADLDSVPHVRINARLLETVEAIRPEVLFVPFPGDIHVDHQRVFASTLVSVRPNGGHQPHVVLAYETLSETNWNAPYLTPGFHPQYFVDISRELPRKLEAMRAYASKLLDFPHERSVEAISALATFRGSTVRRAAAEAFVVIRQVV